MNSAEQARNMEVSLTDGDITTLKRVEEAIVREVSDGNNICWIGFDLSSRAIIELRNLGYSVENESSQREGTLHKIVW